MPRSTIRDIKELIDAGRVKKTGLAIIRKKNGKYSRGKINDTLAVAELYLTPTGEYVHQKFTRPTPPYDMDLRTFYINNPDIRGDIVGSVLHPGLHETGSEHSGRLEGMQDLGIPKEDISRIIRHVHNIGKKLHTPRDPKMKIGEIPIYYVVYNVSGMLKNDDQKGLADYKKELGADDETFNWVIDISKKANQGYERGSLSYSNAYKHLWKLILPIILVGAYFLNRDYKTEIVAQAAPDNQPRVFQTQQGLEDYLIGRSGEEPVRYSNNLIYIDSNGVLSEVPSNCGGGITPTGRYETIQGPNGPIEVAVHDCTTYLTAPTPLSQLTTINDTVGTGSGKGKDADLGKKVNDYLAAAALGVMVATGGLGIIALRKSKQ